VERISERSYPVVGGAGGSGQAMARRLAHQGGRVTVTSRTPERSPSRAREIGATGAAVDVRDEASVSWTVEDASAAGLLHGRTDCVGTIALTPLGRAAGEDMSDAYEVDGIGAMLAIPAVAAALKAAPGSVRPGCA
jgi:NAD(P)-dependent dehydrogenase (short-subunit alcohol dehydrogenase family)